MSKPPKPDNIFKKIKLEPNASQILPPPLLLPVVGEGNPKKKLLNGIAAAISDSEKRGLLNHTVVKVKAVKNEVLAGNKVSKLLGIKKHRMKTKENVKNHYDIGIYARGQTTSLLKKIKKRIEADKSDPFNFDKFNEDVKGLHKHYQDKVSLYGALQDHKSYDKSIKKVQQKLKKARVVEGNIEGEARNRKVVQDLDAELRAGESMLNSAAYRIKEYQAGMREWTKANPGLKAKFNKVIDFVTEPLMSTLNQPKESDRGLASDTDGAKKPEAAHAHNVATKIRSGLSEDGGEHQVSGNITPSPRAAGHAPPKVEGQGR